MLLVLGLWALGDSGSQSLGRQGKAGLRGTRVRVWVCVSAICRGNPARRLGAGRWIDVRAECSVPACPASTNEDIRPSSCACSVPASSIASDVGKQPIPGTVRSAYRVRSTCPRSAYICQGTIPYLLRSPYSLQTAGTGRRPVLRGDSVVWLPRLMICCDGVITPGRQL